MGQVYLYLASWVAGGVLLGAGMLLQQKAQAGTNEASRAGESGAFARARAWSELAVFALVGFGLGGLSCEMANVTAPWPTVCASASGAAFATLAQALRVR